MNAESTKTNLTDIQFQKSVLRFYILAEKKHTLFIGIVL